MRIVLLGATGFVGAALLSEGLSRGHEVTAIARHPEKLEGQETLAVKAGDVYDTDALASLLAGHDALISAFNPGWTPGTQRPEMYDEQVRGTSSIIAAATTTTAQPHHSTARRASGLPVSVRRTPPWLRSARDLVQPRQ